VRTLIRLSPLQRPVSQARKALRHALLVVAALALLGAQALSTLHFVLVPHHLCAVHGVLEDGGQAPSASGGHATATERSDAVVNANASDNDLHDACSVATRSEHGVLLQRPALTLPAAIPASRVDVDTGVQVTAERTALLSQAPKTSPPRA
jgi:hypothetical protein